MSSPWHAVLRDIMIILATSSIVLASLFLALVGWQLWRLAREVYGESEPVVDAVKRLIASVSDTVEYVNRRVVKPAADVAGDARSATPAKGLRSQLARFYGGGSGRGGSSSEQGPTDGNPKVGGRSWTRRLGGKGESG